MKRKPISKRVRFEVFKRDGFKCQYCGKSAPDVVLNADHINPVSKGGKTDILNLITACLDCNSGKSNVELHDDTAIKKQRAQLDELNIKREQLEMLLKWRTELETITEKTLDAVANAWKRSSPGWELNENGLQTARKYLMKYGANEVLNAIEIARSTYIELQKGQATQESMNLAWIKVGGILWMRALPQWRKEIYHIRAILRKRLNYIGYTVIGDLECAHSAGIEIDYLKSLARNCNDWTQFQEWLLEAIELREKRK